MDAVSAPDRRDSQPRPAQHAWISWLRFVAICGVITIHTVGSTAVADGARDSRAGILAILLDIGAIFTVPVFVMLSGAVSLDPAKYSTPSGFLGKRLSRLVPAIVAWHLFYWAFKNLYLDAGWSPEEVLRRTLTGDLATALYFFWIVLGLSVISPVLITWIASATRRQVVVTGLVAASLPVLTTFTLPLRGGPMWIETPWTWWIFYLGLYILGWGLRDVVLRGAPLLLTTVLTLALGVGLAWQWRNPEAPTWLQVAPVNYYGVSVQLYAVLVFLVAHSLIRHDGVLSVLTRTGPARLGRTLGDATLGVFALHIAVLTIVVQEVPVIGGDWAATSSEQMVARVATVIVVTYAIVLVLRRVPGVRRIL